MAIQITILGLGKIGTSVGLALNEHREMIRRVGNDRDAVVSRQAEKLGALDQISYSLMSAVKQADMVLLAEPLPACRETFEAILPDLKPGAVVLDTAPVKTELMDWAAGLLPPERYYVSLTPTFNPSYLHETSQGIDAAHADLFHDSVIMVCAPSGTHAEALKLATDLIGLLGADPLFGDSHEIDGLLASSGLLPYLTAAGLLQATTHQAGWREARKVAGPEYYAAIAPVSDKNEALALVEALRLNRENAARTLGDLIRILTQYREMIQGEDDDALREALLAAVQDRDTWLEQRRAANWNAQQVPTPADLNAGGILGRLFGIRKRPDDKKSS